MHEIDGNWYCEDCCFYCEYCNEWEVGDEYTYVENYGRVCDWALNDGDFRYCQKCGGWYYVPNLSNDVETEDGNWYCSPECAHNDGYIQCYNDYWYPEDEVHFCDKCDRYVPEDEWDEDHMMCCDCAEDAEEVA